MLTIATRSILCIGALSLLSTCEAAAQENTKPHAVFVVGTPHYDPISTMPELAKQLKRAGFRTTVVLPKGNPEKNPGGMPGLDALKKADVAIFCMRFLTLPDEQLKFITDLSLIHI